MQREIVERGAWRAGVLGALSTATAILAQRAIVMVCALGGIWLTFLGLQEPDVYKLGALAIFAVGVMGPAVWLAGR